MPGVFKKQFPLGLGTTRFPVNGPKDIAGFEQSVQIVLRALEAGIDYIDIGHTYSDGMSLKVLREAFSRTQRPFSVTAKVQYTEDWTSDDARRRVETYLNAMGLEKAQYFTCWSIRSYHEFEQIMAKGGVYEGALKLKDEGIIDHICCSLHTPLSDMARIIESGAFEGATVSYSLLNAAQMQPVLDAALCKGVGVAVMNPLGGGLIPENPSNFSFACGEGDQGNTVHAALRFVKAHPAVDIVLSGAGSVEELEDSLSVFRQGDPEEPRTRMDRVLGRASSLEGYCTGCKYCAGCPQGIPTYALMQARNALLFSVTPSYNRQGPEELLYDLQIFHSLWYDHDWHPDSDENPCVRCGRCEQACTQKLKIMDGVADMYRRAGQAGYTKQAHTERLRELLEGKGYQRVGLYPNNTVSNMIMELCGEISGKPAFEWLLFNSNPEMWGRQWNGFTVHAPAEISELRPDMILVCSYRFEQEIAEELKSYEQKGIRIEKLHRERDVPWVL